MLETVIFTCYCLKRRILQNIIASQQQWQTNESVSRTGDSTANLSNKEQIKVAYEIIGRCIEVNNVFISEVNVEECLRWEDSYFNDEITISSTNKGNSANRLPQSFQQ